MSKMNICKNEENWTCGNNEVVVDNPLKILWEFHIISCIIHGKTPIIPLSELCEKENGFHQPRAKFKYTQNWSIPLAKLWRNWEITAYFRGKNLTRVL